MRHPGHVDSQRIHALRAAVDSGRHEPLDLPGETIRLDTSRTVDFDDLASRITETEDGVRGTVTKL